MHNNYILVVGEDEEKARAVSVRNYKTKEQTVVALDQVVSDLISEIEEKRL